MNSPAPVKSMKKESAVDCVVNQVSDWITSGAYHMGDKLPAEGKIAELTGVGRSSIREAMRLLSARGLVVIKHGSGTYVSGAPLGVQIRTLQSGLEQCSWDVDTLIEFRATLEKAIAGLVIQNASDEVLQRLNEKNRQLRMGAETAMNQEDQYQIDLEFHHMFGEASGNVLVSILYDNVMQFVSNRVRQLYDCKISNGYISYLSHQRIIDALLHRDGETVEAAITESVQCYTLMGRY